MTHSPAIREMDTRGGGGDDGNEASPETAEEEVQRSLKRVHSDEDIAQPQTKRPEGKYHKSVKSAIIPRQAAARRSDIDTRENIHKY